MLLIMLRQKLLIAKTIIFIISTAFILPIKSYGQTPNDKGWVTDPKDNRIALIIGNDHYQGRIGDLGNAINDAKAIRDKLNEMGYSVELIDDGDSIEMRQAMKRFIERSKTAKVAFFFYAGHGLQILSEDGLSLTNQLLPVDYETLEGDGYSSSASKMIDIANFLSKLEVSGAETRIVILDACRNIPGRTPERITDSEAEHEEENDNLDVLDSKNAIRRLIRKPKLRSVKLHDGVIARTGFSEMPHKLGTLIVYSAGTGQIASDGIGNAKNSPFTTALLKHIDNPDQKFDDILKNVKREVNNLTSKSGQPQSLSIFNNLDRSFFPVAKLRRIEFYKRMQTYLKRRGCYNGSIDGRWGQGSSGGLDRFKKMSSLPINTKSIDMGTLNTIRDYLATTPNIEFCNPGTNSPLPNTSPSTNTRPARRINASGSSDSCTRRAQRWCANPSNSSEIGFQACMVQAKAGCRN